MGYSMRTWCYAQISISTDLWFLIRIWNCVLTCS
jgi:hypothetical protein